MGYANPAVLHFQLFISRVNVTPALSIKPWTGYSPPYKFTPC